jgi:hypothetical protein
MTHQDDYVGARMTQRPTVIRINTSVKEEDGEGDNKRPTCSSMTATGSPLRRREVCCVVLCCVVLCCVVLCLCCVVFVLCCVVLCCVVLWVSIAVLALQRRADAQSLHSISRGEAGRPHLAGHHAPHTRLNPRVVGPSGCSACSSVLRGQLLCASECR